MGELNFQKFSTSSFLGGQELLNNPNQMGKTMKELKIDLSCATCVPNEKLWDLADLVQINLEPLDCDGETHPYPWDCVLDIQGENLVLEGGFASSGYGECKVSFPKIDVNDYFDVSICFGDDIETSVLQILKDSNIQLVNQEV